MLTVTLTASEHGNLTLTCPSPSEAMGDALGVDYIVNLAINYIVLWAHQSVVVNVKIDDTTLNSEATELAILTRLSDRLFNAGFGEIRAAS